MRLSDCGRITVILIACKVEIERYGMIEDRDSWSTFVYTGLQVYTKRCNE